MQRRKVWEVDIDIIGPIAISEDINFEQEKGFDQNQFYSNITFHKEQYGVASTVTAYANSNKIAKIAAFVFLGHMVDILIFDNEVPLLLQDHNVSIGNKGRVTTRRTLKKEDFILSFNIARKMEVNYPLLLKAIGWYAKGKNSNNTLDSFLAYWNVIEILGTKYHTLTDRTQLGVINMVYQCFLDYLGAVENWGVYDGWINEMHDRRNRIAHGGEETSAEAINNVAILIPRLSEMAKKLLSQIISRECQADVFLQEEWLYFF